MVGLAGGQPPPVVTHSLSLSDFPPLNPKPNLNPICVPNLPINLSFANTINQSTVQPIHDSLRKEITIVEGVPQMTEEEVNQMTQIEDLQYAVIGKFTFDWLNMEELRNLIPQQCGIKGGCQIGLFRNKHVLIRLSQQDDFVNLISKGAFLYHMQGWIRLSDENFDL
ncbi:hypothetical protein KY290_036339 [Solanum tuberosum]|uniref:DUF4283 domain-containing protein n=2 Tax=Solanum tuberosum TaxID=4113 RepID=M1AZZ5_SOLTU|nr:hypothetical protein KY289_035854 [Solanum tuberosum]KAH0639040.1 hypothetical protein KY285_035626 [Solanum tuberosum]KAH0737634.1 hypothetical protein KY290_036339 [Solanum tuberosum]